MIKQALEVYSLTGKGYQQRETHGYAWTKDAAASLIKKSPKTARTAVVHLIQIGANWHRIHVTPITEVEGHIDQAAESRIEYGDFPNLHIPAIYLDVQGKQPCRMSLNIEKTLEFIGWQKPEAVCTLYTLRKDALRPLTFKVRDAFNDDATGKKLWNWLTTEIEARK